MRYRTLRGDEVMRHGDEMKTSGLADWHIVEGLAGYTVDEWRLKAGYDRESFTVRRKVKS